MNIENEISFIKMCKNNNEKKNKIINVFNILQATEIDQLPDKPLFVEFVKLYINVFEDASCLRPLVKKYNFSQIELQNSSVLCQVKKSKRVSWDKNLVEIREIESCKKRIKKNSKIYDLEKQVSYIYEYDVQKICECDTLIVKDLLIDISQYFEKM